MSLAVLSLFWAIIGLLLGGVINVLSDDLPARQSPRRPHCPRCGHIHRAGYWLAITRRIRGGACPECGLPPRQRTFFVEVGMVILFAALPWLIEPPIDLAIYSAYIAVLVLVIVIDLEHRLVLHVVTFPTTVFALVASYPLTDSGFRLALVGAVVGFVFFFLAYLIGERFFGRGALGFGDVTLAMMMGAMLGFQRIFFALILGILLAGLWGAVALLTGRLQRRSYFAYGPFLAAAGIIIIIWGNQIFDRVSGG